MCTRWALGENWVRIDISFLLLKNLKKEFVGNTSHHWFHKQINNSSTYIPYHGWCPEVFLLHPYMNSPPQEPNWQHYSGVTKYKSRYINQFLILACLTCLFGSPFIYLGVMWRIMHQLSSFLLDHRSDRLKDNIILDNGPMGLIFQCK